MPDSLDTKSMARLAAREISSGEVVALGPGLPTLISDLVPGDIPAGAWFLTHTGILNHGPAEAGTGLAAATLGAASSRGGSSLSFTDVSAMVHGGHVDTAVIETAWVTSGGAFGTVAALGTTAAEPLMSDPGPAVELAACSRRVIAMMPHTKPDGSPAVIESSETPPDGQGCVSLVITDLAVLAVEGGRVTVLDLAPGWTFDQVAAATGVTLAAAPDLREMSFDPPQPQTQSQAGPQQKVYSSGLEAVRDLPDGAVVNIDGFAGPGGMPHYLMVSLRDHGAKELTLISNTAGITRVINFGTPPGHQAIDHSILVDNHQVKKAISSYPVSPSPNTPTSFELALQRGEVELEVVPQGTLAERIRAGGAGVAAFYTPTGVGTLLADGKETRTIDGKEYVLEQALKADYCLIRGHKADTLGNVVYKGTSRNFNPIMAMSAGITIVEVDEIVEPGVLSSEEIVTPGVYVDRIVLRPADFSPYD